MWPLATFTICFRGLMVIHRVETVNPNFFEVGVVKDRDHFLRINTIKNGVLSQSKFFKKEQISDANSMWSLEVDNPIAPGVSTYTHGPFERRTHSNERDYRWITELGDLFPHPPDPTLEQNINPEKFLCILKIPNGIFSTRLKSEPLRKLVNGTPEPFGCTAAVVACDIPTLAGSVRLIDGGGEPLFTFEADENTIYEFANTPSDVPVDIHGHEERDDENGDHDHDGEPAHPVDPCQNEHFMRYYQLFNQRPEKNICFRRDNNQPAPDPATCGAAGAGDIKKPFGGDD